MATIVDVTPRPSRRRLAWVGAVAFVIGMLTAKLACPIGSGSVGDQEAHRLQVERNGYLRLLCVLYDGDASADEAQPDVSMQERAAESLCACVARSSNPAIDCNTGLRVWAVMRDAQRCAGPLRDEAPAYCACLDPIAQLVTRAAGMDVARRRAYGYDECRRQADVPPLPPPPDSTLQALFDAGV